MSDWKPIETAPKDKEILLLTRTGHIYQGKLRYGFRGEPQQEEFSWRASCCGRFSNPTHWMILPEPPED